MTHCTDVTDFVCSIPPYVKCGCNLDVSSRPMWTQASTLHRP